MSSFSHYKELGAVKWNEYRQISNADVATTIVLHTPQASMRTILTNVVIGAPIGGSIAFYFHKASNQKEAKVLELRGTSTTSSITPSILAIEGTAMDCPLQVRVNTGATDAWSVTAEGFDFE